MKKVLVAISSDLVREMYKDSFYREGFEVLTAADGRSALKITKEELPSLVLADVSILPPPVSVDEESGEMGGFQLLRELKKDEKTARIPFIIYSRMGSEEYRKRAMDLEARDFVKGTSLSPRQVAVRAKAHLGSQRSYKIRFIAEEEAFKMAEDLGHGRKLECPQCGKEKVLYLLRDLSRGAKNDFKASLVCPHCSTKRKEESS